MFSSFLRPAGLLPRGSPHPKWENVNPSWSMTFCALLKNSYVIVQLLCSSHAPNPVGAIMTLYSNKFEFFGDRNFDSYCPALWVNGQALANVAHIIKYVNDLRLRKHLNKNKITLLVRYGWIKLTKIRLQVITLVAECYNKSNSK